MASTEELKTAFEDCPKYQLTFENGLELGDLLADRMQLFSSREEAERVILKGQVESHSAHSSLGFLGGRDICGGGREWDGAQSSDGGARPRRPRDPRAQPQCHSHRLLRCPCCELVMTIEWAHSRDQMEHKSSLHSLPQALEQFSISGKVSCMG